MSDEKIKENTKKEQQLKDENKKTLKDKRGSKKKNKKVKEQMNNNKIKKEKQYSKDERQDKKEERQEKKEKKKIKKDKIKNESKIDKEIVEKRSSTNYTFIYFFMAIMLIALFSLIFILANEKYSLLYKNPVATIDLEGYGKVKIELEPTKAPNTVNHFIKLVQNGYYDGLVVYGKDAVSLHFGRNKRGEEVPPTVSMVDKTIEEDSELDYEYEIDGEFERNNFKDNDIKHEKYVVSLVRADYSDIMQKIQHYSYNAGTGMFKILIKDAPGMNGNYAAFGRVIEGTEIIDELANRELRFEPETEEDEADLNEFKEFVIINSITVETFGRKFEELKLHKRFVIEEFFLQIFQDYL